MSKARREVSAHGRTLLLVVACCLLVGDAYAEDVTGEAAAAEEAVRLFCGTHVNIRLDVASYDPTSDRRVVRAIAISRDDESVVLDLSIILIQHRIVFMSASGRKLSTKVSERERARRRQVLTTYVEKWTRLQFTKTRQSERKGYTRLVFCCINDEVFDNLEVYADINDRSGLLRIFGVPR